MTDTGIGHDAPMHSEGLLYDEHVLLGARFRDDGLVASYGDAEGEAADAGEGAHAAICDVSACGKLRIAGRPAAFFLEGMLECDMHELAEVGNGTQAVLAMGRRTASVELIRSGTEEFMLLAAPEDAAAAWEWLSSHADAAQGRDAAEEGGMAMSDESESLAALFLAGADAAPILRDMLPADGEGLPAAGMLAYEKLDGHGCLVYCMPLGDSYLLLVPPASACPLWRGFLSFPEVDPIGMDAFEEVFSF